MTKTVQQCSWAVLNDTHRSIISAEDNIEDNSRLLLSIADSMSNLCEKLSRLEYALRRKNIEQMYQKGKEKQNED
jgi:hypothetical protein